MPDPRAEIWASRHGLWSRSPPPPDSKTPHDRYVLGDAADRLAEALRATLAAADSHYAHFDREGTAGANCPACIARREANEIGRAALAEYEEKTE